MSFPAETEHSSVGESALDLEEFSLVESFCFVARASDSRAQSTRDFRKNRRDARIVCDSVVSSWIFVRLFIRGRLEGTRGAGSACSNACFVD